MGYFEDMQVQEKLYTPNVTYNYDAFTFWSNDYTQKNGYDEQEHHIPANRVVIQQHPAVAYLKGIATVQVMSPAQFQLTKRAKWNTNNMLHYTRLLSAIFNQFGQMLTIIVAAKPENAEEHQWLFDVDYDEDILNNQFIPDLLEAGGFTESDLDIYQTKSHYGVIVPHGFNTIDLLANYPEVELKRDDLRYVGSFTRNAES